MIRENPRRLSPQGSPTQHRFPLVALLVATGLASAIACSSDDADDAQVETEALEIEPVTVPERELPAPVAPAPGSDAPNGVSLPLGLADWKVIGVVNVPAAGMAAGTVRVILGNDIAVDAARSGETNPWPDRSMMGHLQWTAGSNPDSGAAVVPGPFAAATVMMKDSEQFAADGGWAYGVWRGTDLLPPVTAPGDRVFDRGCVECHTSNVADNDFVFTVPGILPSPTAIAAAATLPNGLELPAGILDWRVIGVASRETDASPTIRVIVGNDIAVEAARAGDTNPWPDGSMLAHYSWAAGENPNSPDTVNPVAFAAFTLMVKDSDEYAADGGWAYGVWSGLALTAPEAADPGEDEFDRACVDCHTATVPDNDFVFTVPGELPDLFTNR